MVNKTLIIGEHGFCASQNHQLLRVMARRDTEFDDETEQLLILTDSDPAMYEEAYDLLDCPGAMIWSIRAHNEIGGFSTHSEGKNIYRSAELLHIRGRAILPHFFFWSLDIYT